jgi:hypothetical protein
MAGDELERAPSFGVLTRRRFLTWGIGSLLFIAGIAFLVGHLSARKHTGYFDWELASIFGTALGTTMLAIATGALAYTTSGDVQATRDIARLTREDQLQRERPLVLVQYAEWMSPRADPVFGEDVTDFSGALRVNLRNVGLGPALRVEVSTHYIRDVSIEVPWMHLARSVGRLRLQLGGLRRAAGASGSSSTRTSNARA